MESVIQIEEIAKVCHEANRAYCEVIGDSSQPQWKDAPDWQRQSGINGVDFHLRNPNASPGAQHEAWLRDKVDEGWKEGPVKDTEKKEHPCCVPYDELPEIQKVKDAIFVSIVNSMKTVIGEIV